MSAFILIPALLIGGALWLRVRRRQRARREGRWPDSNEWFIG